MNAYGNRGDSWQLLLDTLHTRYNGSGRASVIPTPAPMKILRAVKGKPGHFVCCFLPDAPPDYTAQADGFAFCFDAKDHAGDRWPLKDLPEHQARRFDAHQRQGGVAFVLLRLSGTVYLLPWATLAERWHRWHRRVGRAAPGIASLSAEECAEVGVRLKSADWLPAALAIARGPS
jgi:recombination protein U